MKKIFLSTWLRDDGEIGEQKGTKKRTEREKLKEDVTVFVSVEASKSSVKGRIWRVVVVFLSRTFWRSQRTCLIVSLILVWVCLWCLM